MTEWELAKGKHTATGKQCRSNAASCGVGAQHAAHAVGRSGVSVHAAQGFRRAGLILCIPALALVLGVAGASLNNAVGHADDAVVTQPSTAQASSVGSEAVPSSDAPSESFILETGANRSVDGIVAQVQEEEEAARVAAEEAARVAEQEAIQQAQEAQSLKSSAAVGIGDVDFSVGYDAFMAEWTSRIDSYLAGSPLAGYGADFAQAAWENAVDPRWSPAISCTESTKGTYCYMAYNAWGWHGYLGSDWTSAIHAHVAGLANGYGHTITRGNAARYCPPNADYWYSNTLSEMAKI